MQLPPARPLPARLERIRQMVARLPDRQRRDLLGRLTSDLMRRNDELHREADRLARREQARRGRT